MKKILLAFFAASLVFSCAKKTEAAQVVEVVESAEPEEEQKETWEKVEKPALIVFGHSFNDEKFVEKNVSALSELFGADSEGGFISKAMFPADFEVGGKTRVSAIKTIFEDGNYSAVVSLGAPEGFSAALANAMDDSQECKVVSLFPQDDVLSVESVSFAVLSMAQKAEEMEQELNLSEAAAARILEKTVSFLHDDVLGKNKKTFSRQELQAKMQDFVGDKFVIAGYVDAETGISSANHFIMQEK